MTTNLVIGGRAYDMERATVGADLNLLIYAKRQLGVTMRSITDGLDRLNAGESIIDLLSDDQGLESLRSLIWLCRTQEGERGDDGRYLTIEDANKGIGFLDLDFVDTDVVEEPAGPDEPHSEGARPTQATDGESAEVAHSSRS